MQKGDKVLYTLSKPKEFKFKTFEVSRWNFMSLKYFLKRGLFKSGKLLFLCTRYNLELEQLQVKIRSKRIVSV